MQVKNEEKVPGFSSNQGLEGAAPPVIQNSSCKDSVIVLKAHAAFDQSHAALKTLPQIFLQTVLPILPSTGFFCCL